MRGKAERSMASGRWIGWYLILDNGDRTATFSLYAEMIAYASMFGIEIVTW